MSDKRELTEVAQAERNIFNAEFGDGNCSCHISPPCGSCVHPGNPVNQEDDDECWTVALWAIHIQGPDDLFAMPSKEAAESHAEILNKEFKARKIEGGENYPTINVAVIPWNGSAESHANNMTEHLKDAA